MGRRLRIFSVALAVNITLSCIPITAQQNDESPNAPERTTSLRNDQQQSQAPEQGANAPTQPIETDQRTRQEQRASAETRERQPDAPWWENPDWWQVILIVAGTAIATAAFLSERRAVRLTERADILVQAAGFADGVKSLTPDARMVVTLKNFGNTRADNVVVDLFFGIRGNPSENAPAPRTIMGAGDMIYPIFPPLRESMPQGAYEAAVKGQIELAYGGTVTYQDVFGRQHTLTCAGTFDRTTGMFTIDKNEST